MNTYSYYTLLLDRAKADLLEREINDLLEAEIDNTLKDFVGISSDVQVRLINKEFLQELLDGLKDAIYHIKWDINPNLQKLSAKYKSSTIVMDELTSFVQDCHNNMLVSTTMEYVENIKQLASQLENLKALTDILDNYERKLSLYKYIPQVRQEVSDMLFNLKFVTKDNIEKYIEDIKSLLVRCEIAQMAYMQQQSLIFMAKRKHAIIVIFQ